MSSGARCIVIVLPDLRLGGGQRVLIELARQFHREGYEVEIVSLVGDGELLAELPTGIAYVPLSCSPSGLLRLVMEALPKLTRHLRRVQPDGIISSMTGTNLLTVVAHAFAGRPGRLLLREAVSLKNIRGRWVPWLMRRLYRRADCVLAVSTGVANDLVGLGIKPALVKAVPNPIDRERVKRMALETVACVIADPYVVSVGRLIIQKDHATLLRAYAKSQLRATHRLVLVGDGSERPGLELLAAELGIKELVVFTGALGNPYPILSRARLHVLCSRWEGYPNVLLEALALDVPVVATDCPAGPREMLQDGRKGRLAPVGNAQALADAMDMELQQPSPGRELLLAEHMPHAIAKRYLAALFPSSGECTG